jgi:hypothetical protein
LTGGIAAVIFFFIGGLIIGIRKLNHPPTKIATPLARPRLKKTAIKRLKRRKR